MSLLLLTAAAAGVGALRTRTVASVTAAIEAKNVRTISGVTAALLEKRARTIASVTGSIGQNLYPHDEERINTVYEYGGIDVDGVRIAFLITVYALTYSELGGWPHEWSDPTNPHVSFRFQIYLDDGGRDEISRIDFEEPGSAVLVLDGLNFALNMPLRLLAIYPTGDIDLGVDYLYLDGTDEP